MTKTLSIIALVACLCLTAVAQTANTPPATAPAAATAVAASAPSAWNIGAGLEANTYQTPIWVPFVHVDACWTGFCEITTVEMGASIATLRQDFGYKMKTSADGHYMLIALVGGSVTTANSGGLVPTSVTLGGVGGGVAFRADLGGFIKPLKGQGVGVLLSMREAAVTSAGVKPQYAMSLSYRFK